MIRSSLFSISRSQLVQAASAQYLRRMWPVFASFPVFGIVALVVGTNPYVRAIGLLAILWPFSIPARIAMASWGKAKRLMRPTWVHWEDGVLYFHDDKGGGMMLPAAQIRRVDKRGAYYVFETRRFNFALVPVAAFDEKTGGDFERAIFGGDGESPSGDAARE